MGQANAAREEAYSGSFWRIQGQKKVGNHMWMQKLELRLVPIWGRELLQGRDAAEEEVGGREGGGEERRSSAIQNKGPTVGKH